MLPESIVEELTRNTALSSHLIKMAWPSLSTAARLQIIQRVQALLNCATPEWLTDLALADDESVVRYWASRYAHFNDAEPRQHPRLGRIDGASAEERDRKKKARGDSEPLVRFTVDRLIFLWDFDALTKASHVDRLVKLRNAFAPDLGQLIDWLEKAIAEGVADDELQECAAEFFALPSMDRNFSEDEFGDGMDDSTAGETMKKGWRLTKVAGRRTAMQLAMRLPLKFGLGDMTASDLVTQPDHVLTRLIDRAEQEPVAAELVALIQARVHDFAPEVVERINRTSPLG